VTPQPSLLIDIAGVRWRVGREGHDLSIPLDFGGDQPRFFGAPAAAAHPLAAGSFTGEVGTGSSCNCSTITLTPHCNGTHTESLGHLTRNGVSVRDAAGEPWCPARLVSVRPSPAATSAERAQPSARTTDLLITRMALQSALDAQTGIPAWSDHPALIVRSLRDDAGPHNRSTMYRNYDSCATVPYFSSDAMHWIVEQGVRHLVVDLPSVDRGDSSLLTAHRLFWGLPTGVTDAAVATRPQATITELAWIDERIADGAYLLNLQVAPFVSDAAPSRPVLLPLLPLPPSQP